MDGVVERVQSSDGHPSRPAARIHLVTHPAQEFCNNAQPRHDELSLREADLAGVFQNGGVTRNPPCWITPTDSVYPNLMTVPEEWQDVAQPFPGRVLLDPV